MQTIKLYRVTYTKGPFCDGGEAYTINEDFALLAKAQRCAKKTGGTISTWVRKCYQKDLNFWLASLVQRGTDHTPDWVTVSNLLRLGADPTVSPMGIHGMRLPSAIETCQEMAEAYDPDHGRMLQGWNCSAARAREICAKTQKHFQGYLNQFAKAGYTVAA